MLFQIRTVTDPFAKPTGLAEAQSLFEVDSSGMHRQLRPFGPPRGTRFLFGGEPPTLAFHHDAVSVVGRALVAQERRSFENVEGFGSVVQLDLEIPFLRPWLALIIS